MKKNMINNWVLFKNNITVNINVQYNLYLLTKINFFLILKKKKTVSTSIVAQYCPSIKSSIVTKYPYSK